jgi:hypothetical protein
MAIQHKAKNIILTTNNIFDSINKRVSAGNGGCTVFVPHVCNNIDQFGAGFAAQVADKYPSVKANYHMLGKNYLKTHLGYCQVLKVYEDKIHKHGLYFANMIAQNGLKNDNNTRPLNYFALMTSMYRLSQYIKDNTGFKQRTEQVEIHAPKFGSGLAGGNWPFIENLIEDIWSEYTVYVYQPNFGHNR